MTAYAIDGKPVEVGGRYLAREKYAAIVADLLEIQIEEISPSGQFFKPVGFTTWQRISGFEFIEALPPKAAGFPLIDVPKEADTEGHDSELAPP